jgi:hypothetical protein
MVKAPEARATVKTDSYIRRLEQKLNATEKKLASHVNLTKKKFKDYDAFCAATEKNFSNYVTVSDAKKHFAHHASRADAIENKLSEYVHTTHWEEIDVRVSKVEYHVKVIAEAAEHKFTERTAAIEGVSERAEGLERPYKNPRRSPLPLRMDETIEKHRSDFPEPAAATTSKEHRKDWQNMADSMGLGLDFEEDK